jgi:phosphoenolpyruvate-protein kinase (PTS system EI component)
MIETRAAVERAGEIAAVSDFLSVGTNDLTHSVLATNRFAPGEACSHHPDVVRAIAATTKAADAAGLIVEVCGEAASDRVTMPLLLGLGIQELSVGAARVGAVRGWVRALRFDASRQVALAACEAASAGEVATLVDPLSALLGELDDAAGESVDGGAGIVTLGGQT